jgi:beta-lactamase regulating signal transducer with metallopeptidase domain
MNPLHFIALDLFLKSAAILAAAGLCTLALRRASAAMRHAAWLAAVLALLLLPLTKAVKPRWKLQPPPQATVHVEPAPAAISSAAALPSGITTLPAARHWQLPAWRDLALGAWAAGALSLLAYQILGLAQLARYRRRSVRIADSRLTATFRRVTAELRLRRVIDLRMLASAKVPVTWGFRRHVLLLPQHALDWDEPQLEAALRHELAHIARRDYLTRTLAQIACALYWPNPLAWLAARSLRREQEHACDDLVLNAGTPSETYASLLLEAARELRGARLLPAGAVAMARPSTLEGRVLAVVDETRNRRPAGPLAKWVAVGVVALSAIVCCAAQLLATETPATASAGGKQIEIEVKFIEVSAAAAKRKEIASLLPSEAPAGPLVMSDERYTRLVRALNQQKGIDILSAPRVTTRDGQRAQIEVGRPLEYPDDWVKGPAGWKAKGTKERWVGTTFTVTPTLNADGATIVLYMEPSVSEFGGYRDLDTGKTFARPEKTFFGNAPGGKEKKLIEGRRVEPIFVTHKISTRVSLASGYSVVIPRLPRVDRVQGTAGAGGIIERGLFVLVSARFLDEPPAESATKPTALKRAEKMTLPRLVLRDAPLSDALDFLRRKSVELDPEHKGINFVMYLPSEANPKLSVSLNDIPLSEAARAVANAAGLAIAADEHAIIIGPAGVSLVAPDSSTLVFGGGTLDLNVATALTPDGKTTPRTVTVNPAPGTELTGSNTLTISGSTGNVTVNTLHIAETAAVKKAKSLVLPRMEFREATLGESVEFFKAKARTLDPDGKGLNIVMAAGVNAEMKVTLSLTDISIWEALGYVARLAKVELTADENGLVLQPRR